MKSGSNNVFYFFAGIGLLFVAGLNLPRTWASYQLRENGGREVVARLVTVSCGKRDEVTYRLGREEIVKRAYLSEDECRELRHQNTIRLLTDDRGTYVFAEAGYDDNFTGELYALLALGLFSVGIMGYGLLRGGEDGSEDVYRRMKGR